jgi:hypothetical protein
VPKWKNLEITGLQLSDKYDRERLALPSNLTGLRNKERDPAPHLATVSSSSRASTQTQTSTIASRRAETREAAKKKAGEISEDWRRGPYIFLNS